MVALRLSVVEGIVLVGVGVEETEIAKEVEVMENVGEEVIEKGGEEPLRWRMRMSHLADVLLD